MIKIKKKGNVLIYSLVLVNVALVLSLAVFNNFFIFLSNTERGNINKKLSNNILYKGNLFLKYTRTLNSNGNGIVDILGCPVNVTMSGDTVISTSPSLLAYTGGVAACTGMHNSLPYTIHFNSTLTNIAAASFFGDGPVAFTGAGVGERKFFDYDNTEVDVIASLPVIPDGVDDDFNSDNYKANSTGAINYPNGYYDDDVLARATIYGYISPGAGFENIIWTTTKTSNYITSNINNNDTIFDKIGNISAGKLFLDVDNLFNLRIIQIDKSEYDNSQQIIVLGKTETESIGAGLGYIQNNSGSLSLSAAVTGNEYIFDFTSYDYAIFIDNEGIGVLTYVLSGENATGSGVYINSIDDSSTTSIKYLGADLLQDKEGFYIGKMFEVIEDK